jgi:uncharacterized protein (TIGR01777 family)
VDVVVTGATGFIGRSLTKALLARGNSVVALTRNPERARDHVPSGAGIVGWENGRSDREWARRVAAADAIVNLTGEPIADKRWTSEQKRKILDSRVKATEAIVDACRDAGGSGVLVNGSAIGFYGAHGDEEVTEVSARGHDFLSDVVVAWEDAATRATATGRRVVLLRTGIVLGTDGGALPKLLLPFRLFAGGVMGPSDQWMSWIHIDDQIGIILHVIDNPTASGPINATAPNPVTMKLFSHAIGRALYRPVWAPGIPIAMRMVLGERAEVVFASQNVHPGRALEYGYEFKFDDVTLALGALLS